jgi:hypothetical protein
MASIVEYNEREIAVNAYPKRIISPPHPSECCSTRSMAQIGDVEEDGDRLFIYKRCRTCGYTVRHFAGGEAPRPRLFPTRYTRLKRHSLVAYSHCGFLNIVLRNSHPSASGSAHSPFSNRLEFLEIIYCQYVRIARRVGTWPALISKRGRT